MRSQRVRQGSLEGRRREKRWPRALLAIVATTVLALLGLSFGWPDRTNEDADRSGSGQVSGRDALAVAEAEASRHGRRPARSDPARFALAASPARTPVRHEFGSPPKAGLLFDVETGEILWEHHPDRELPIASLTKMMTAQVIVSRHRPDERVEISAKATRTGGSMVGVLPEGDEVKAGALLKGLLLVSGNDAATALAEHDSGSVPRFVAEMNRQAQRMGLGCSRFTSPHGLEDRGNHSCPRDLAAIARANLANARLAAIASSDRERLPFPVEGGILDLYNQNPFIRAGDETITGLKTGYTEAAGRCYVTTAERGGRHLGVVLLDSPDPLAQVPKLLELGAKA